MARLQKIDLTAMFDEFERSRCVNDDGKISFRGMHFGEISTAIGTFVEFSDELPKAVRNSIVTKAIFSAAEKGRLTRESLERTLKAKERDYLRLKSKPFYYLSSISLVRPPGLTGRTLNGQRIMFTSAQPRKFNRNGLRIDELLLQKEKRTASYANIRLKIHARCQYSAFDTAQKYVDLFRSIWNYYLNPSIRRTYSIPGPVNTIISGPIHTIHLENGNPAGTTYWYEPQYPERITPKNVQTKYGKLRELEKGMVANLNKSNYREDMIDALVRYCRALDLTDFEAAFLKIWSVIESLTNTVGGRYDDTIKRCSFLFQDANYHKSILQHLRYHRNASVHRNQFTEESEKTLYQAKMYADSLLSFHIFNSFRFSSLHDAGDFLSSSTSIDALRNRLKQTEYALRFLGYYDRKG